MLKNHIPVFTENKEKIISMDQNSGFNFILEGDNLHSLYLLEKTHRNKIDAIYIDPPYNTEKGDFIYDDSYVDKNDTFRHSKWISFMSKRLTLAWRLLSQRGVIMISIDDHEMASLRLLRDSLFGEDKFVANIVWQKRYSRENREAIGERV